MKGDPARVGDGVEGGAQVYKMYSEAISASVAANALSAKTSA